MVLSPHTLIGATSIQRRSRQLCSAHSASCTPLAPSNSVYLYGASSQTWRMNISPLLLETVVVDGVLRQRLPVGIEIVRALLVGIPYRPRRCLAGLNDAIGEPR